MLRLRTLAEHPLLNRMQGSDVPPGRHGRSPSAVYLQHVPSSRQGPRHYKSATERPASGARRSRRVVLQAVVRRHAPSRRWRPQSSHSVNSGHPRSYSITLSARSSNSGGIITPRAFAVFRLTMRSNLVARSIGKSPGLAPLSILSTKLAARAYTSRRFEP